MEPLRAELKLTERCIQSIKPPKKRTSLSDGRGLELRVTPDLKLTWSLIFRFNGKKTRYTIGAYPSVKLKDARVLADKLRSQIAHGINPQQQKLEARNCNSILVNDCYKQFLERHLKQNLRTWDEYDRRMRSDVLPAIGQKDIRALTKANLLKIIDAIMDRNAPVLANRVLQYMSKFFKWCVGRGYLDNNPVQGIPKPAKERSRERVLSLAEVTAIYRASDALGSIIGGFVKILILTGQRRSEIAELKWSELSDKQINISRDRSKNDKPITTPLTARALSVLNNIPRNNGEFVFSTTGGHRPIGSFSKIKARLQKHSQTSNWTYHDFRRAIATYSAEIGFSRFEISEMLNHTDNSVTGVYDRSSQLEVKERVLICWETAVAKGACLKVPISSKVI